MTVMPSALTGNLQSYQASVICKTQALEPAKGFPHLQWDSSPGTTQSSQESDGAPGFLVSPFALWVCHWPALSFGAYLASTASMTKKLSKAF